MAGAADKVEVETPDNLGKAARCDAAKDHPILSLIERAPLRAAEVKVARQLYLPDDLCPGGATAGGWLRCVQPTRHAAKPLARSKA